MNRKLKFLLICFSILASNYTYSEGCNYQEIKKEIEKQGFQVARTSNFYHNLTAERITELSERFDISREEIKLRGLHSIEYSFEDITLDLNNHHQFILLKFNSETDVKKVEINEKKNIVSSIKNLPTYFTKAFDLSQVGIKRIRNYNAVFLFGKDIRERSTTILTMIKGCKSFDFENFFSKSTLPIIFSRKEFHKNPNFSSKEIKAVQDAMYTSELETESSLNKQIKITSKEYIFKDKYHLHDELELEKVNIKLENYSEESFFSVDVFVIYFNENNKIIDVMRSISYTVKPKALFEVESRPSRINGSHATSADVIFTISNPLKTKSEE